MNNVNFFLNNCYFTNTSWRAFLIWCLPHQKLSKLGEFLQAATILYREQTLKIWWRSVDVSQMAVHDQHLPVTVLSGCHDGYLYEMRLEDRFDDRPHEGADDRRAADDDDGRLSEKTQHRETCQPHRVLWGGRRKPSRYSRAHRLAQGHRLAQMSLTVKPN